MPSFRQALIASAMLAVASAQGVITKAQGARGSPASLPFLVNLQQSDANIINQNEIATNVVNECGRTLLSGNIDIGGETETQLANKTVTSVTKGSNVEVTINKINNDGAGPFTCDMDQTSNANGVSGQTPLKVTEKDNGNTISLSVEMPADMKCIGASTGDICTVRCFNKAATGPFGGCFAVQQTDVTPNQNTADNIVTAQTLDGVLKQIAQNIKDFPAANQGLAAAGTDASKQAVKVADALLSIDSSAAATAGAPAATTGANTGNANTGKGSNRNGKNSNSRAGNNAATDGNGSAATNANGRTQGQRNNNRQRREQQWSA